MDLVVPVSIEGGFDFPWVPLSFFVKFPLDLAASFVHEDFGDHFEV